MDKSSIDVVIHDYNISVGYRAWRSWSAAGSRVMGAMIHRISHAGLLVPDIERAAEVWTGVFGLEPWALGVWHAVEEGVRTLMLPVGEGASVELLETVDPGTPFQQALDAGRGLYHMSLRVADLDQTVQRLRGEESWVQVRPQGEVLRLRRGWVDPASACGAHIELIDEREILAMRLPVAEPPPPTGVFDRFSHVGQLVPELDAALRFYRDALGLEPESEAPQSWVEEGARALRFSVGDGPKLEVVEVSHACGPLWPHFQRHGPGLAYLGMEVADLDRALDALSPRDLWLQQRPGGGALPRRVWVHPRSTHGALLRLTEGA
jgi:catechol 2,3-dioxygenase-like lactoylglutathione lyase family enzyme